MNQSTVVKFLLTVLLSVIVLLPSVSFPSSLSFAKIEDIPGSSLDVRHRNEIDLQGFGQGITVATSVVGGASRPDFSDFTIFKKFDKATPKLALFCASGRAIPEVVITIAESREGVTFDLFRITLEEVLITSVRTNDAIGADSTELVTFNFRKIIWRDMVTGIETRWDLVLNR